MDYVSKDKFIIVKEKRTHRTGVVLSYDMYLAEMNNKKREGKKNNA